VFFGQGRQESRQEEAVSVALRQLNRLWGPLREATTVQIQALTVDQLEAFADALLDFTGTAELATWLAATT